VSHVFYLHGFASSPASSKATFFAGRLGARGIELECPDLNEPDFSTLTVSRMLRQVQKRIAALPAGDVVLIGSSLGGFVAVETAARQASDVSHPVSRLVLLAPAVELEWEKWSELGFAGVEGWRRAGKIQVFHYALDEPRDLNFTFYEDAIAYHVAEHRLPQPMLIFHGRNDESVSPAVVERFAARQPRATLFLLDDAHQLRNSLEFIWQKTAAALRL
jgi:hypothetical protein